MKTLALMIVSLCMAGCAAQARAPEPVPVDKVECARCRMLLSSDVGAGEIVSARDETRFYDDVGCLAADWTKRVHDDPAAATTSTPFVRVGAGSWADARTTWFAKPESVRTAMGSGVVAFATASEAEAADRDGRARSWSEVTR